ncbi:hypothetical protein IWQ56_000530 [Coemansia nantahalensis]|nr:hypothetical protein IWQ56_000530 [Coemansia nantahalensis]
MELDDQQGRTDDEEGSGSFIVRLAIAQAERDEAMRAAEAARRELEAAKRRYDEFVGRPVAGPPQDGMVRLFSALPEDPHEGNSTHAIETADPHYKFECVSEWTPRLQESCARLRVDPQLENRRVRAVPLAVGRLEDDFANHLVDVLQPRVSIVSNVVFGRNDIVVVKLGRTYGVDMTVTADDGGSRGPVPWLPVEVKRRLPVQPERALAPPLGAHANFVENFSVLSSFSLGGGFLQPDPLWKALTQAAHYLEYSVPVSDHIVIIAKNAVFLMRRVAKWTVQVSDAIPYTSVDLHPVAMIVCWLAVKMNHPWAPRLIPPLMARPVAIPRRHNRLHNTRSGGRGGRGRGSGGGAPGAHRPHGTFRASEGTVRPLPRSAPTSGTADSDQDHGQGLQHKAQPDIASVSTEDATGAGPEDAPDSDRWIDTDLLHVDTLEYLNRYRCEVFTATWGNNIQVVVKGAEWTDEELAEEIHHEISVYHQLRPLQGRDVPRLYDYGYLQVDGRVLIALVLERISDPDMLAAMSLDAQEPLDLDRRLAQRALSSADRMAYVHALGRIHRLGVAHNDVRGANVMLRHRSAGEQCTPAFIDFGFSTVADGQASKAARARDFTRLLGVFEGQVFYT